MINVLVKLSVLTDPYLQEHPEGWQEDRDDA
jgi:hypothetical protein